MNPEVKLNFKMTLRHPYRGVFGDPLGRGQRAPVRKEAFFPSVRLVLSDAVLLKDSRGHRLNTPDELTIHRLMRARGETHVKFLLLFFRGNTPPWS